MRELELQANQAFSRTFVDLEKLYRHRAFPPDRYGDQAWVETPVRALAGAAVLTQRGPTPVMVWGVPPGWHTLDIRLFQLYRRGCDRSGNHPLVIRCYGLREALPSQRQQEIERLDALAHAIEGLWEATWLDVAVAKRPGLVIVRADGAMPISADVRKVWLALSLIARNLDVSSADVSKAYAEAKAEKPTAVAISQMFKGLRRQGLLHPIDTSRRPVQYLSLAALELKSLRALSSAHVGGKQAGDGSRATGTDPYDGAMDHFQWDQLYGRLHARGLRTIGAEARYERTGRRRHGGI